MFEEDPRLLGRVLGQEAQMGSGSAGGWAEAASVEQEAVVWKPAEVLRNGETHDTGSRRH